MRPLSTMELYSDTYYIQRVLAGDTACFACLIDRYGEPIHALILKVVRNPEDAEELAQDTFLKAFKSLGTFKGDCGFSTWLYRIAYNTALSSLRKKRPEYLMIDESTIELVPGDTIEALVIDQLEESSMEERLQELERAMERLQAEERALLLLYYWQEKPVDEIGYRLSVFQPSYTMARSLSIYIGTLALLLLLADHLIRKALRGKKGKLR